MRSIPQALLWELWARGWFQIPAFFLLGNVFPVLILTALHGEGLDPAEQAWLIVHTAFLSIMMLLFAVGIMSAQGPLSRLYAAPVSTMSLVAWHMFSGAALLALEVFISLEFQRLLIYRGLSVAGPSLFAIVAWASAQPLMSVPQRTVFGFLQSATPCMLMFFWLQSRYGGWFSQPTHYWTELRGTELLLMAGATAGSFWLTCRAVARDRCGELNRSSLLRSLWNRLVSVLDARGAAVAPFRSSIEAQLWYEWHYRGRALPLGAALTLCIAYGLLLIRLLQEGDLAIHLQLLHEGLVAGGGVLALLAALTGLLAGSTSTGNHIRHHNSTLRDVTNSGNFDQMGHFPATRPLSDRTLADCVLWNVGRSVVTAWALWLAVFLPVVFVVRLTSGSAEYLLKFEQWRWFLPLTLTGAWVAMMLTTLMTLTGRCAWFIVALFNGVILIFCLDLAARWLLPESTRTLLFQSLLATASALIIVGTLLTFHYARRRQLLEIRRGRSLLMASLLLIPLAVWVAPPDLPKVAYAVIVAFFALAVLPFAAAPLAFAWNRHR